MRSILSALCIVILAWSFSAVCMASVPPSYMQCEEIYGKPGWNPGSGQRLCFFPPHVSKYVHPLNDVGNYAGLLHPVPLPKNGSLKLIVQFHGWGAGQWGPDETYNDYIRTIVINNDYDYGRLTPDDLEKIGVQMAQDWGIALTTGDPAKPCSKGHCEAILHRLTAAIHEAHTQFGDSIDKGAGITLSGNCYGGTAIHMVPLVLPDERYRAQITVVNAAYPGNLFVRQADGLNEFGTAKKAGMYWQDESIRKSWGDFDIARVDVLRPENKKRLKNVYFHSHSGSNDYLGYSLDFFREVCDGGKIACLGTWYISNHVGVEPGLSYDPYQVYSGPDMSARLDSMLPVFTHATSNHWGERGHYNLGLEWKNEGFVDSATRAEIPIRYMRRTDIGLGIPDQPTASTFGLTIRRFKNFQLPVGAVVHWQFGNDSGTAVVEEAGEVTIPQLTRHSSALYEPVILTKGP